MNIYGKWTVKPDRSTADGGAIRWRAGKRHPEHNAAHRLDVPHGAFKVVGDKPIRYLSVHIVDKDKPLYDIPK